MLSKNRLRFKATVAAACLLQFVSTSFAATTTSTFPVTVTIVAGCTITGASTLNFGSQGALAANVDASSTVQVQCTNTTPYNIGLDAGTGVGASTALRKMTSGGGSTVNYAMYTDSGRTINWGNAVGTDTVAGSGTGTAQSYTVYGRVPAQPTPAPGVYNDTVTVTVTY